MHLNRISSLTVLATIFSITGCATSSISHDAAKAVPADRIFLTPTITEKDNAKIIVVRDTGFTGGGVFQHLYIDGKEAARLNPGEKAEFILPPGDHILGAIPTNAFGQASLNTIDQKLESGKRYFYRIQTDGNSFRTVVQRYLPMADSGN
ncbi:hypothetical protein [Undibacterium sp. Tian12W]|uniref:hypothetical protein n=1 Tax=Undibacterium sp. Tian12W TaxID=3413054 RepID=UPI003BF42D17